MPLAWRDGVPTAVHVTVLLLTTHVTGEFSLMRISCEVLVATEDKECFKLLVNTFSL